MITHYTLHHNVSGGPPLEFFPSPFLCLLLFFPTWAYRTIARLFSGFPGPLNVLSRLVQFHKASSRFIRDFKRVVEGSTLNPKPYLEVQAQL